MNIPAAASIRVVKHTCNVGCDGCNGFGWVWSDGAAPTLCPGGGAAVSQGELDTGKAPTELPCGRRYTHCSGCDRRREDVGNGDDVARTKESARRKALIDEQ